MKEFMKYLEESTVSFFAVENLKSMFGEAGFEQLPLHEDWQIKEGGKYFVTLWDSACIAFTIPEDMSKVQAPLYRMIGAHTDQPCFRIKPGTQMNQNGYCKLNVEVYGGPIFSTWLDRPLSLAGRVTLKSDNVFKPRTELIDLKKPVLIIPNLAVHMNRGVNDGVALNAQVDMLPVGALVSGLAEEQEQMVVKAVAETLNVALDEILDFDLFTYVTEKPELVGFSEEFLSAPRLDDLVMVHTAAKALVESKGGSGINMLCAFDHEECGSRTPQGAGTGTITMILEKLSMALGRNRQQFIDDIMQSFMISGDVAHAIHPNHPERHDPVLKTQLGGGPVIKLSANQSYVTQSCDYSVYEMICKKAGVPVQKFANKSDSRGGSTLGPVVAANVPCHIMDMGVPILSMHSSRELMAAVDYEYTKRSFVEYYNI